MKVINVNSQDVTVTRKDISSFEEKLKISLPISYKNYLLRCNGGNPDDGTYSMSENIDGDEEFSGIDWFYSISNDYTTSLEKNINTFYGRVPYDMIPIGEDGGGNQICLGISGERYGKVYFWDHDWESDEDEPWYENVYLIANSFEDFINKLYKFDIVDYGEPNERYRSIYDKYALPTSHYIKHYKEGLILDFFAQAPNNTEDFIIDEYKDSKSLVLFFDNKKDGVRKKRILYKDSRFEDIEEKI
jgi:hypothetical protein